MTATSLTSRGRAKRASPGDDNDDDDHDDHDDDQGGGRGGGEEGVQHQFRGDLEAEVPGCAGDAGDVVTWHVVL